MGFAIQNTKLVGILEKYNFKIYWFFTNKNQEDPHFKVFVNILVLNLVALEAIVRVKIFLKLQWNFIGDA